MFLLRKKNLLNFFLLLTTSWLFACSSIQNYRELNKIAPQERLPYKASLKIDDDPRDITINVKHKGDGIEQVRESVRYEATKYCLVTFGSSDVNWQKDGSTGDWVFQETSKGLLFRARCEPE
jgi:hypothetical protein